ncbi:methyltransferase domain-containing protein [candidate division KSB1 bacterium]|nr:methyltransferase domain-containing protein [candidate division KSB1 bacterium]
MELAHLKYLICPNCQNDLTINEMREFAGNNIQSGSLSCRQCHAIYPIVNHIPRFVSPKNYAANFGLEWSLHARTQYDSESGINESQQRFFKETTWPRNLENETILEVGCGSGRFTEHAASTGAMVISIDYSNAVDANYSSNGHLENVLIIQADLFHLPVRQHSFDKLFCIGVIQHTPDPHNAFKLLVTYLKPHGHLVIDVYKKSWHRFTTPKPYLRPLLCKLAPEKLYRLIKTYIDVMWPVARQLRKIPFIGRNLNWLLGIADYSNRNLNEVKLKQWAYLDSFDMFSPRYDKPQTLSTVKKWFQNENLTNIDIRYGYNGIEARAKVPDETYHEIRH